MAETTFSNITAAAVDADLRDRVVSAVAAAGIPNPQGWAEANMRRIVSQPVSENDDTMASVYAYAVATYNPTPRPGQNEAAVTDTYIRDAVAAVHAALTA